MSTTPHTDLALAQRALGLLDLTELSDDCTVEAVERLCARATGPAGAVAAVCVWPRFVDVAKHQLEGTGVRIATVVNFPSGDEPVDQVVAATRAALGAGADEIDVVLPYRGFVRGEHEAAAAMLDAVSLCLGEEQRMKVILETGELPDPDTVAAAAQFAITHGADFVKTSTGKTPVSATLEAAGVMLEAIRHSGRAVGLKPSGGIRTIEDAAAYLDLADTVMGPRWASPHTFRFGASGLLDSLVAVIEGHPSSTSSAAERRAADY